MDVSLTIKDITLKKYLQLNKILHADKKVKGWIILHVGQLNMDSQFSSMGEVVEVERTGICLIAAKKVK